MLTACLDPRVSISLSRLALFLKQPASVWYISNGLYLFLACSLMVILQHHVLEVTSGWEYNMAARLNVFVKDNTICWWRHPLCPNLTSSGAVGWNIHFVIVHDSQLWFSPAFLSRFQWTKEWNKSVYWSIVCHIQPLSKPIFLSVRSERRSLWIFDNFPHQSNCEFGSLCLILFMVVVFHGSNVSGFVIDCFL